MALHLLEVYEPYEYPGPNPLRVSGTQVLRGPNGDHYYLIQSDHDGLSERFLVSPKYVGDPISRAETSMCTVNICRVAPDAELGALLRYADFCHWGVGKITPRRII